MCEENIENKITKDIEKVEKVLRKGGTAVYPTETVYGIGVDAFDEESVEKMYDIKKRPRDKPVSIAVEKIEKIEKYATVKSKKTKDFLEEFLPGPVTPLLPVKCDSFPKHIVSNSGLIGFRIPDNSTTLELLCNFSPITSTSANFSGKKEARKVEELDNKFIKKVDIVLDGKKCKYGKGSTVVDTTSWEIVREGVMVNKVNKWIEK